MEAEEAAEVREAGEVAEVVEVVEVVEDHSVKERGARLGTNRDQQAAGCHIGHVETIKRN